MDWDSGASFEAAIFAPSGTPTHVFQGFFVLLLVLVSVFVLVLELVVEDDPTMTSTSTIRLGGLSTSTIENQKRAT
jgi:hypothetical protein